MLLMLFDLDDGRFTRNLERGMVLRRRVQSIDQLIRTEQCRLLLLPLDAPPLSQSQLAG